MMTLIIIVMLLQQKQKSMYIKAFSFNKTNSSDPFPLFSIPSSIVLRSGSSGLEQTFPSINHNAGIELWA